MTHLAGDLVRTSTLESKNTGCGKLGTLLCGHLDQGPITYMEGIALAMLVSLCDRLALEVTQNGSGRYPLTPHTVNKLPHVLRKEIWSLLIESSATANTLNQFKPFRVAMGKNCLTVRTDILQKKMPQSLGCRPGRNQLL